MSKTPVTVQDVYNAFVERCKQAPSFVRKTETYDSFNSEGGQRPALYVSLLNSQVENDSSGLPAQYTLNLEVHCRADRGGYPDRTGPEILLPLELELIQQFRPDPLTGFCTLGFSRGWVMHVFNSSTEYFYDLIQDDDSAEMIVSFSVLCAPKVFEC